MASVGDEASPDRFLFAVNVLAAAVRHLHRAAAGRRSCWCRSWRRWRTSWASTRSQFAIIVIVNLTMGMITPPVGGLLFVTCKVAKVPMIGAGEELWPFLWAHGAVLVILTSCRRSAPGCRGRSGSSSGALRAVVLPPRFAARIGATSNNRWNPREPHHEPTRRLPARRRAAVHRRTGRGHLRHRHPLRRPPRPQRGRAAPTPAPAARAPRSSSAVTPASPKCEAAVRAWAAAWSARDVDRYLAAYRRLSRPRRSRTRSAGKPSAAPASPTSRRSASAVDDLVISVSGQTASARFKQVYSADKLKSTDRKTLELQRVGNKWLIRKESTGG